jgi:3-phenylpropionate/cinnamic acid dioxygenase small subunit
MEGIFRPIDHYVAIVALLNRYATAVDTRDWDLLASCFTEDATAELPLTGHHRGNRTIAATLRQLLGGLDSTQHIISNHVIEFVDGEVRTTCYFQAQHYVRGAAGGSTFTSGGRYRDRLVEANGEWRIRHRTIERMWTDGNSSLLPPALLVDEGSDRSRNPDT